MDTPPLSPPTKSTNATIPEDDSRLGYSGCYTCGAITPCAKMHPVIIVREDGSVIGTPAYECPYCFEHDMRDASFRRGAR